jgi:glutamate-1-semialdehyde aminotransferase
MMMKNSGAKLWHKAKRLIPGGNQLLSKRSEQFLPDYWPAYYTKAKGVDVWDLDHNHYIDMSIMGIGACPLGYADPDVDAAVKNRIENGSMCTLNSPDEVELAEKLIHLHHWAEMVRYARCGGEAMAIAVRIARAHTKRDAVAFCGYHGWHDWYLAANLADDRNLDGHLLPGLAPAGVPRGLIGSALPFQYNHADELEKIVERHRGKIAAIVLEPIRDQEPAPGFLAAVQKIAKENDAVLIADEVSSGFRLITGGAHLLYGLKPDIAVFAKAMSNGYPMAAIIGQGEVMQAAQDTFISSTYWTEGIGPVAALATIAKYERCNIPDHLVRIGTAIQKGWVRAAAEGSGLDISVGGIPPLSHLSISGDLSLAAQTLYSQIMLEKGFLAGKSFYACYAHRDEHVEKYLDATTDAFEQIAKAMKNKNLDSLLRGPVAKPGFHRLT